MVIKLFCKAEFGVHCPFYSVSLSLPEACCRFLSWTRLKCHLQLEEKPRHRQRGPGFVGKIELGEGASLVSEVAGCSASFLL